MAPRNTNSKALTKKHIARLERERRQSRMIVWAAAAVVVIVFGLIGYSLLNEKVLQPRQAVATVGEEKITTSQFQARVRLQRNQIISQYAQYSQFSQMFGMDFSAQLQQLEYQLSESGTEALGKDVLDSMINEILLRNEAKNLDIAVSEEEIQNRIHEVFGYFPNGEPAATVTPTEVVLPTISAAQAAIVTITPTPTITATPTLELTPTETPVGFPTITMTPNLTTTATASLVPTVTPTVTATAAPTQTATPGPTSTPEPTATPLSEQGFEESFAGGMKSFSEMGVSEADYRKLIELDILRTQIFDIVTADVKPVQEQVWARHILAPNRVAAMTIRERLLRGEDFATLAAKFSLDTSNKDAGGDLGWFGKGQMVGPFEEAAFSQKVGEIGEPVQTDFGWHIIQVIGHEERPLTADLFDQAKTAAFDQWLSDLRAKAEKDGLIEIFDIWMDRVPLDPDLASALGQQ